MISTQPPAVEQAALQLKFTAKAKCSSIGYKPLELNLKLFNNLKFNSSGL